jgi:predicted dehydrogenase
VETSLEMTGNWPFSIELRATGDKGTINYALTAGFNINDEADRGSNLNWYPAGEETSYPIFAEQTDMFAGEINEFFAAIRENRPAVVTPQDSRNVLEIVVAMRKSLEEGCVVEL